MRNYLELLEDILENGVKKRIVQERVHYLFSEDNSVLIWPRASLGDHQKSSFEIRYS